MASIDISNPGSNEAVLRQNFRNLSTRRPKNYVTAIGDSRTAAIYADGNNGWRRSTYSPLNWARCLSGQNFILAQTFGVSGQRTDQFISSGQLTNAIATGAGTCVLWGGLNDIAQGYTALQAFTNLKYIAETLVANGFQVVVDQEVGANNATAAMVAQILELRQRLREWAPTVPDVYLHDAWPVVMNLSYSATVLQFNTDYTYDGVHYNGRGAYYHGKSLAKLLTSIIPPRFDSLSNRAENATNNAATILSPNPTFEGTTGVINTGITGTCPTNTRVGRTGSATGVSSIITLADGSKAVKLDATFTARGERVSLTMASLNDNWTTGTIFNAYATMTVENPINIAGFQFYPNSSYNGSTLEMGDLIVGSTTSDANAAGPLEGYTVKCESKIFTYPTVTTKGWLSVRADIVASGAGSGTLIVSNMGIRKRLNA